MNTVPSVNPEDLQRVWKALPALQEQSAGGLTLEELKTNLTPGADFLALIAHCVVLQAHTKPGEQIDFTQAAKEIALPIR